MAYANSHAMNGPGHTVKDDDTFEQDLKEMLKDGVGQPLGSNQPPSGGQPQGLNQPPLINQGLTNQPFGTNQSRGGASSASSDVGAGTVYAGHAGGATSAPTGMLYRPNTLPSTVVGTPRSNMSPPATSTIPLTSPEHGAGGVLTSPIRGTTSTVTSPQSRLDGLRAWSFNTYKFTRQLMSERLGRGTRTVDAELETRVEALRDTQAKYAALLRLSRALASHFAAVTATQRALGDVFGDMALKSPELRDEFSYNAETQRALCRNGDALLAALNFFSSTLQTLCNKTMDDTLLTIKQYEAARVEYDAYRSDVEALQNTQRDAASQQRLHDAQQRFQMHREKFERLRSDVAVKMQFLDENRVKVMQKQLLLFHNAVASYFSGNQTALEETLKQFNIKMKTPNSERPSWLESHN